LPDIFLSYSRDDQSTARRFAEAFEREGLAVWWDQTLRSGENYDQVTESALREAKAVVVLWSKHSVDSRWVRAEATQADRNGTLVPVMIEPCNRPIMFELKHTAELGHWKGEAGDPAWKSLLGDVRQFVKKEGAGTVEPAVSQIAKPPMQFGVRTLLGIVALLVVGAAVFWLAGRTPKVAPKPAAVAIERVVTLAVLPFTNLSGDPTQEYFSDGLTEEILNQLTQVKDLRVTGRTSSFYFKGKNEDLRVIGEKLDVANILVGSVRKAGNQLRITTQLIDIRSRANLWSQTYNRDLTDVFKVQEEIAAAVSSALRIKLDVGEMSRAQGGTTNLDAYEKYLQAQAILRQGFLGEQSLKAVQLLRDAVEMDSAFVSAWAVLADALRNAPLWKPDSSEALLQESARAEERVLALAPDGHIAQFVQVRRSLTQHRWSEAASAAERKLGSKQEQFDVRRNFLAGVGRIDELISRLEALRQQDPLNLTTSTDLQMYLDAAGRPAEAQAEYERSKNLPGNHNQTDFFAMMRHMASKDADPATFKATFRSVLKSAPVAIDPSLTDKIGDKEAASAVLHTAFENPANKVALRMGIIAMYAGHFGDRDLVIEALRQSVIDLHGSAANTWLAFEPGLRADPRFKDLLRDLGLVDYFRANGNWGDFCKPMGKDDFECH
jgi:TolB-like protein